MKEPNFTPSKQSYYSAGDESEALCYKCDCCLDDYDWENKQFKFCPECGERIMTRDEIEELYRSIEHFNSIAEEPIVLKYPEYSMEDFEERVKRFDNFRPKPIPIAFTRWQYESGYGRIWCENNLDYPVSDERNVKIVIYPQKRIIGDRPFHWALIKYDEDEKMWESIEFGWEKNLIIAHIKSQKSYKKWLKS